MTLLERLQEIHQEIGTSNPKAANLLIDLIQDYVKGEFRQEFLEKVTSHEAKKILKERLT